MRIILFALVGIVTCLSWGYLWPVKSNDKPAKGELLVLDDVVKSVETTTTSKPFATYVSILEKPLFEPSRRKPVVDGIIPASNTVNDVGEASPPVSVRIGGKITIRQYTKVLVKSEDSIEEDGLWLEVGETFDGGQILKIADSSVLLLLNGEEIELPIGSEPTTESNIP